MSCLRNVLMTVGLGVAVASAGRYAIELVQGWQARDWPTVEGQVISSEIGSRASAARYGSLSTTYYSPRIVYRYEVDGRRITGSRIWFGHPRRWEAYERAVSFVEQYPPGNPVPVRYDPEDPDAAYLISGRPSTAWLILAGLGLLFIWFGTFATDGPPLNPRRPG